MNAIYHYSSNRPAQAPKRLLQCTVPDELIEKLDRWGVGAGMRSRAEAIRTLIEKGLENEGGAQ